MRTLLLPLVPALLLAPLRAEEVASDPTREAMRAGVVEIVVTYQDWNEHRPWEKLPPRSRRAAAVVVGPGRLLTTAQMVREATHIELRVDGTPRDATPVPVVVDMDLNLALLRVEDAAALAGLRPVELASNSPTSGTLWTARWRRQRVEAAASRVARLEVQRTRFGNLEHLFLSLRTDLAGGGWGEPIFHRGKLVGVTSSQDSRDQARAIPVEVLAPFLARATSPGPYPGFTAFGAVWQPQRDPVLAAHLGLPDPDRPRGVLLLEVPWGSTACGELRPRDLLLEVAGEALDSEGNYVDPLLGRLGFEHLLTARYPPGSRIPVKVLRAGEVLEVELEARTYPPAAGRIPRDRVGPPPFVLAGGLILRELDLAYLRTWGNKWATAAPLTLRNRARFEEDSQGPGRRRFVVLTDVLPAEYNVGYHGLAHQVVARVNGREVDGLDDVVEALRTPRGGVHVLELTPDGARGVVVLDAGSFPEADGEIRRRYGIEAPNRLPPPPPPGAGACAP